LRVSVTHLIEGGIRRFHSDYKLTAGVVVVNPLEELEIDTNIESFEDVLSKLLMNAWESYGEKPPEERSITIHTSVFDRQRGEKMLELRVDDMGGGISEEIRDRMFEPFVSTKRTVGVGMGLTVARHSLRTLGGEVTMVSKPGGGSSAIMVHPVRDPRQRKRTAEQDDE
jgi:two-component system, sensor histidine kinase and response regulator